MTCIISGTSTVTLDQLANVPIYISSKFSVFEEIPKVPEVQDTNESTIWVHGLVKTRENNRLPHICPFPNDLLLLRNPGSP
jgi:hypothetical protein